jgi:periplasmic copper chaperone A
MRILLFLILLTWPAAALMADQGGIQLDNVWSRTAIAGRQGVVYLTITDQGQPDALVGATTPIAARAELHQSFDDNGVMKMRPVSSLPVEPGKPVTLAPGGYHIMLVDLKRSLKAGDNFPVTLTFATAGQVTATVTVQSPGAAMPPSDRHPMPGMGSMPQHMPMHSGDKQP